MSRYVDIEGDWVDDAVKAYSLGYYDDDEYAIPFEALGSAPSIDIVRCRECKWSKANGTYQWCGRLDSTARITDDDFCSRGERKCSEKPNNCKQQTNGYQTFNGTSVYVSRLTDEPQTERSSK